jgi:hypothetical protein
MKEGSMKRPYPDEPQILAFPSKATPATRRSRPAGPSEQASSTPIGPAQLERELAGLLTEYDALADLCYDNCRLLERLKLDLADAPRGHKQPIRDQIRRAETDGHKLGSRVLRLEAGMDHVRAKIKQGD